MMSANQCHAAAENMLGTLYEHGEVVPRDYAEAAKWYSRALANGHTRSQLSRRFLARRASKDGIEPEEVLRRCRQAAEGGDVDAQSFLGYLYSDGEEVPQDYEEAIRWYTMAAEAGDVSSQFNLGSIYSSGEVPLVNESSARMWLNKAAAQGDPRAESRLAELDEAERSKGIYLNYCDRCETVTSSPPGEATEICSCCHGLAAQLRLPVAVLPQHSPPVNFSELINRLSGRGFERLLGALFASYGFLVQETALTGDFGVDLVLVDDLGTRIAVQAKRHKNDVGVSAVQEIWAGMAHYNCSRGILAVSSRLTPQAAQLLKSIPSVSLLTRKHIHHMAEKSLRNVLILELEPTKSFGSDE